MISGGFTGDYGWRANMLYYDSQDDIIEEWEISCRSFKALVDFTHIQYQRQVRMYFVYDISCFWGKLLLELEYAVL